MKKYTCLFDLDGVILDTEGQYSFFWNEIGKKYFNDENFGLLIKGQTLSEIFLTHFSDFKNDKQNYFVQTNIKKELNIFESNMDFPFIKGAIEFINELKSFDCNVAIVTSSNLHKMKNVYKKCPQINDLFPVILTSENFSKSKPNPECYLLGEKKFNAKTKDCFVFEDSFHGLASGRAAKMTVIGLATTNSYEKIFHLSDFVINDFSEINMEKLSKIK